MRMRDHYLNRVLFGVVAIIFLVLTVLHFVPTAKNRNYGDLTMRYNSAKDFMSGNNPYLNRMDVLAGSEDEQQIDYGLASKRRAISLPMSVFFYMPFLPYSVVKNIFFYLQTILFLLLPILIMKRWRLGRLLDFRCPGYLEWGFSGVFFVYANASPVIFCLTQGQPSLFITFFLYYAFFMTQNAWKRSVLLSLCVIAKYSLMPLYLFFLIVRKEFKVLAIVAAFVGGANILVITMLFDAAFLDIFSQYLNLIQRTLFSDNPSEQFNGMIAIINFDYIFNHFFLEKGLKISLFLGLAFIYIRIYKKASEGLSVLDFFLISLVNMVIVYHRLYDSVLILPLFFISAYLALVRRSKLEIGICLLVSFVLLMPAKIAYPIVVYGMSKVAAPFKAVFLYQESASLPFLSHMSESLFLQLSHFFGPVMPVVVFPVSGVLFCIVFLSLLLCCVRQADDLQRYTSYLPTCLGLK